MSKTKLKTTIYIIFPFLCSGWIGWFHMLESVLDKYVRKMGLKIFNPELSITKYQWT